MKNLSQEDWIQFYDEAAEICSLFHATQNYSVDLRISSVVNLLHVSEESLRIDPEVDTVRELRKIFRSLMDEHLASSGEDEEGVMAHLREVFIKKNKDYGASFSDLGLISIFVRLYDKMKRLKELSKRPPEVVSESSRDSRLDGMNYCMLALAYIFAKGARDA